MGSPDRLFNRQRTLHQILGSGILADIILWRHKNLTAGIVSVTVAVWLVFEKSGYTLLSLVSRVLLLLAGILFLWAKSAAILNRPAPPLPQLQLSEELVGEVASLIGTCVNDLLSAFQDIALGRDSRLFFRVVACLWLISFIGGFTDILTLGYTSLVSIFIIPALYERYEGYVDNFIINNYRRLQQLYVTSGEEYVSTQQAVKSLETTQCKLCNRMS